MQNPKGLGELIKELRVEKNLSQKELAEKCGLTQQAINRIEHNQRNIEFGLLLKFTKVLDLSIPDLIEAGIKLEPDEIALLDTLINTICTKQLLTVLPPVFLMFLRLFFINYRLIYFLFFFLVSFQYQKTKKRTLSTTKGSRVRFSFSYLFYSSNATRSVELVQV